jgi:hypothetical protein
MKKRSTKDKPDAAQRTLYRTTNSIAGAMAGSRNALENPLWFVIVETVLLGRLTKPRPQLTIFCEGIQRERDSICLWQRASGGNLGRVGL